MNSLNYFKSFFLIITKKGTAIMATNNKYIRLNIIFIAAPIAEKIKIIIINAMTIAITPESIVLNNSISYPD